MSKPRVLRSWRTSHDVEQEQQNKGSYRTGTRRQLARSEGVRLYAVFHDKAYWQNLPYEIEEMARHRWKSHARFYTMLLYTT